MFPLGVREAEANDLFEGVLPHVVKTSSQLRDHASGSNPEQVLHLAGGQTVLQQIESDVLLGKTSESREHTLEIGQFLSAKNLRVFWSAADGHPEYRQVCAKLDLDS